MTLKIVANKLINIFSSFPNVDFYIWKRGKYNTNTYYITKRKKIYT